MITKIKNYVVIAISSLMMTMPGLVPAVVYAGAPKECDTGVTENIAKGVNGAIEGANVTCEAQQANGDSITRIARQIVNIFSIVVGAVAVIMIIYGGFRYITSGGDSGNVGNAKNTLIYAVVGLIIVALAQLIVQFVLSTSTEVTSTNNNPNGTNP